MGIPGLFKEIGSGERVALAKLAVEHLERTKRPLRIAIDAAIWNFQTQAAQGGKNPALRTFYFRLLRILALPIHPLFVFDGPNKPPTKRGRTVAAQWRGACLATTASKRLLDHFRFPHHVAPGEAEAECTMLQRRGVVDMVMSEDGDAIMFGSRVTLRNWSAEGTSKGNKRPTHVSRLDATAIKERSGIDAAGMVLVALLRGGDYNTAGVTGFGPGLACEVARAGFGHDLLEIIAADPADEAEIAAWRERLQFELESNESGYFKRRHPTAKIPDTFPDRTLLGYYANPVVSEEKDVKALERKCMQMWDSEIDIPQFRDYVGRTFDWLYKPGAWRFVRGMAPPLLAYKLRLGMAEQHVHSVRQITDRSQHFDNGGIPELRITAVPADVVGIDLDAEEDRPEEAEASPALEIDDEEILSGDPGNDDDETVPTNTQGIAKQSKGAPWLPTNPERMWIPETIVKLGAGAIVEEWEQIQRDTIADPKKFATRKIKKTGKTVEGKAKQTPVASAKPIRQYFSIAKPAVGTNILAGSGNAGPDSSSGEKTSVTGAVTRKSAGTENAATTASKSRGSIQRFFIGATATTASSSSSIKAPSQDASKVPSTPSSRAKGRAKIANQLLVKPRESLLGSWTVVDTDEEGQAVAAPRRRSARRVSCVDLTGE